MLPFCFQKQRFFEGVMKNMIKLMTSWTITEKDLPLLSTPAFDSLKTILRLAESQNRMRLLRGVSCRHTATEMIKHDGMLGGLLYFDQVSIIDIASFGRWRQSADVGILADWWVLGPTARQHKHSFSGRNDCCNAS